MATGSGLASTLARTALLFEAAGRGDGLLFQDALTALGTVPSTAARMLRALTQAELFVHGEDGRYRLAPRMRQWAAALVAAPDLAAESAMAARELATRTGESAAVFVPIDDGVRLIAKHEPPERFQYMAVGGATARCDRHGFCALRSAWWGDAEARRRLAAVAPGANARVWMRRMRLARRMGSLLSSIDDQPGLSRVVATVADSRGVLIALVGVTVTSLVATARRDALVGAVRESAASLGRRLGDTP